MSSGHDATLNGGNENKRQGTISSARFNLLSSMVGGGSLSLPLAFHQTGNLFIAPILLVITNLLAQQSILFLVKAGVYSTSAISGREDGVTRQSNNTISNRKGISSYENTASQAFGSKARIFSMFLVCACCFFGVVGYAVLLRDMLEPIVDTIVKPAEGVGGGPTLARNAAMLIVVLCITPLTTWRNLTALKDVGAASMASVLTVGLCVAYRSIECQLNMGGIKDEGSDITANTDNIRAFPPSMKQLLDAIPLFISSYICHFNVLPIHNELRCPTTDRVKSWVRTSLWPATLFYYVIGFTGSLYAKCTESGSVQGNILLDFDEDDPLLLLGRLCLAMTITLAFPMLVIPARDILVRSMLGSRFGRRMFKRVNQQPVVSTADYDGSTADISGGVSATGDGLTTVEFEPMEISHVETNLEEPLLVLENRSMASTVQDGMVEESDEFVDNMESPRNMCGDGDNKVARTIVALCVFWSAALLACSVQSIDVVWDLGKARLYADWTTNIVFFINVSKFVWTNRCSLVSLTTCGSTLVGSSFSIMLAFLIPCGAYLKLSRRKRFNASQDGGNGFRNWMVSRAVAWAMILLFAPLMVISTLNACYNSFFSKDN